MSAGGAGTAVHRIPPVVAERAGWRMQAACAKKAADQFYGDSARQMKVAQAICADCPVTRDCLLSTLVFERGRSYYSRFGVAGGLTPAQRCAPIQVATSLTAMRVDRPRIVVELLALPVSDDKVIPGLQAIGLSDEEITLLLAERAIADV